MIDPKYRGIELTERICAFCGKQLTSLVPYQCKRCGNYFCADHRLPENHECVFKNRSWESWKKEQGKMKSSPDRTYKPFKPKQSKENKHWNKRKQASKFRYKWNNFKYRLHQKQSRRIKLPIGFGLSLFVPLLVGLFVVYLLFPGITYATQFFGTENTFLILLLFLLIPAEVNSIVPWIAWIISGFVGGFLSEKILIPFISMYALIWVFLFILQGNLIMQQFSMFGAFGLDQIILQILAINIIFSIFAFGFGGWIGASIGGGFSSTYIKKSTAVVTILVIISLVIVGFYYAGFFEDFSIVEDNNYILGDSVINGDIEFTFLSAGWEKYQYSNTEYFYFNIKATNIGKIKSSCILNNFIYETENGYLYEGDTYFETFILDPGRNSTHKIICRTIDKEFIPVTKIYFKFANSAWDNNGKEITVNIE